MSSLNHSPPPNKPALPLTVDRRRGRLYELLFAFPGAPLPIGQVLSESHLQAATIQLSRCLGSRYSSDRIYQYLTLGWLGAVLCDETEARIFCWKLAGSLDQFRTECREAVVSLCEPVTPHWASVLIRDLYYTGSPNDRGRYLVHCLIWSGPFAGEAFSSSWSVSKLHMLWWIFTGKRSKLYMEDAKQMYGMIASACIAGERKDHLQAKLWHSPDNFCKYNRDLTRRRDPAHRKCPYNFQHSCYTCRLGVDKCMLATRSASCKLIRCRRCKQKAFCDPLLSSDSCIGCAQKQLIRRK